jgi:mannitol/fructose-specific phosphotransferase system IIA component (Ntr-type)
MLNLQNIIGQLANSNNPFNMVMSLLPNQNQKNIFSNLANTSTDEEKAQILANICNQNGITKEQLKNALQNYK